MVPMDDNPAVEPPEGRLIEEARERLGVSQNEAAERSGMSGTRWRQIVYSDAPTMTSKRGIATLTRMARVVGVDHQRLDEVGREDVADSLRVMLADEQLAESEPQPTLAEVTQMLEDRIRWFEEDNERKRKADEERIKRLEDEVRRLGGQSG